MSNQTDYTDLHEALVKLKERGPHRTHAGICHNVTIGYTSHPQLSELWVNWPLFSGDKVYPVPAGTHGLTAEGMFNCYTLNRQGWDTSTEYGRLRWQLLDWLIEKTSESELNARAKPELATSPDKE